MRGDRLFWIAVTLAVLVALFALGKAHAHPGRLDASGCHDVGHDFKYKDGRVAKEGSRHCHGAVAGLWFDWNASDVENALKGEQEKDRPARNDTDAP